MRWRRREILVCLVLLAAVAVAFGRSCTYGLINLDDSEYVLRNPYARTGLTAASAWWALTTTDATNWHPLTWLSWQLDYDLYGGRPWGFHVTNVLLHAANSLLLFLVLRRMTGALWRSAAVAALFAVHPLHVESVAWVSERKDVLSALFWMLTLAAYDRYVERPGWRRYATVVVAFSLGLLAKPMLVTLPFVLLLLDYWPLGRFRRPQEPGTTAAGPAPVSWRRLIGEKAPLLVLSLLCCFITLHAQRQGGSVQSLRQFPLWARVGNALTAYVGYIRKAVYPDDLAVYYPHPGVHLPSWQVAAAALFLLAATATVLALARRRPYLTVGWLWYLGTLVPVIGLVQVGTQAMADRYSYVPLIGLFLMAAWGVGDWAAWSGRRALAAGLTAAALLACLACSWVQVGYWRDSVTLWEHAAAATQDNTMAYASLGNALELGGQPERAVTAYARAAHIAAEAVREDPDDELLQVELAHYLLAAGMVREAMPHYVAALRINPNNAWSHINLGACLARLGDPQQAVPQYEEGLRIDPRIAEAHHSLGVALAALGKPEEAIPELTAAVEGAPDLPDAHHALGLMLCATGRPREAVPQFREFLRLQPSQASGYFDLGYALVRLNELEEAASCFRKAISLQPDNPRYYCALASVLQKQGQGRAAEEQYQQAFTCDPNWPEAINAQAWDLATGPGLRIGYLAVELSEQVCQGARTQRPQYLDTLAAAYAEDGDFGRATQTAQEALRTATEAGRNELAHEIEGRLRLYERRQPYRAVRAEPPP